MERHRLDKQPVAAAPAGQRSGPGAEAAASAAPGPPCRTPQAPATPAEGVHGAARVPPPSSASSIAMPDTPAGAAPAPPVHPIRRRQRRACLRPPTRSPVSAPGPPPAPGQRRPPAAVAPQPGCTAPPAPPQTPAPRTTPTEPPTDAAPAETARDAATPPPPQDEDPIAPEPTRPTGTQPAPPSRNDRSAAGEPDAPPPPGGGALEGRTAGAQPLRPTRTPPTPPAAHRDRILHTIRGRRTPQRLPLAARLTPRLLPQAPRPTPGRRLRKPVARGRLAVVAPLQPRTALNTAIRSTRRAPCSRSTAFPASRRATRSSKLPDTDTDKGSRCEPLPPICRFTHVPNTQPTHRQSGTSWAVTFCHVLSCRTRPPAAMCHGMSCFVCEWCICRVPFRHEAVVSGRGAGVSVRLARLGVFGMGPSVRSRFVPPAPPAAEPFVRA